MILSPRLSVVSSLIFQLFLLQTLLNLYRNFSYNLHFCSYHVCFIFFSSVEWLMCEYWIGKCCIFNCFCLKYFSGLFNTRVYLFLSMDFMLVQIKMIFSETPCLDNALIFCYILQAFLHDNIHDFCKHFHKVYFLFWINKSNLYNNSYFNSFMLFPSVRQKIFLL